MIGLQSGQVDSEQYFDGDDEYFVFHFTLFPHINIERIIT